MVSGLASGAHRGAESNPMNMNRSPRFVQSPLAEAAPDAARTALLAARPSIAPKYFYDALGSRLFEAITELDEYYPTRTEAQIFATRGDELRTAFGSGSVLVDLGAGNCAKAVSLFPALRPKRYIAVDVSVDFLRSALGQVQHEHPELDVVGLGQDFSAGLDLPAELLEGGPPLFFYPGSSIGNFTREQAFSFLRRIHARAGGGGILIGVDLVKPRPGLEAAYDDALGVTAAFNLNALRHLNRAIGSDFDPRQWRHVAFYDEGEARIEMHLEARQPLVVRWPGADRRFAAGERIHTENSYKYTVEGFASLLRDAGFRQPRAWTDPKGWFALFRAAA
jgi:dimethylhistidine N-methyltransferase